MKECTLASGVFGFVLCIGAIPRLTAAACPFLPSGISTPTKGDWFTSPPPAKNLQKQPVDAVPKVRNQWMVCGPIPSTKISGSDELTAAEHAELQALPKNKEFKFFFEGNAQTRSQVSHQILAKYRSDVFNESTLENLHLESDDFSIHYDHNYDGSDKIVNARRIRLTVRSGTSEERTIVAYYLNYEKVQMARGRKSVILWINGHFAGINGPPAIGCPSQMSLGLLNYGESGAAAGRLAARGYPMLLFDDLLRTDGLPPTNPVSETKGPSPTLTLELQIMNAIDKVLLTRFDDVDVVGLSGGSNRAFHLLALHDGSKTRLRSAYIVGALEAPWWTMAHAGRDDDLGGDKGTTFRKEFLWEELALVGSVAGTHIALVMNCYDAPRGKYFLHTQMVPAFESYDLQVEILGDDPQGMQTKCTADRGACHEVLVLDYLDFLKRTRS